MNGYTEFDRELIERLIRIEGKLDTEAAWRKEHEAWAFVERDKFDARIQSVETFQNHAKGALALLTFLWGTLVIFIGNLWKRLG